MLTSKEYSSFIFTHIPKCGGTSFREFLNDSSEKSSIPITSRYIPGFNSIENEKNIPQLNEEELSQLRQLPLKMVACHSKFDVHNVYKLSNVKNPFYYTILREPLSRFISHYFFFYFKHNNADCKDIHLNDLPKDKLVQIVENLANIQTRWICNDDSATAEQAIDKLNHTYGSFGLLEYFKESIEILLAYKPSWLTILDEMPFSNSNKSYDISQIEPSIIELINEYNATDTALYNEAKRIFIKRYLLL